MTSLLARVGAVEARFASQTLWSSGKRKRKDWICAECRNRRALRQRRGYSDNAWSLTLEQSFFPPREENDDGSSTPRGALVRKAQASQSRPWGLAVEKQDQLGVMETRNQSEEQQTSLWEQFEQAVEVEGEGQTEAAPTETREHVEGLSTTTDRASTLLNIDYASELSTALLYDEPDMVARCLVAASKKDDVDFIRSIPTTTFVECIRLLQPSNFMQNLANAHLEISEAVAKSFGVTSIADVAWQHSSTLQEIVNIRHASGIKLGLTEYKMLLRAARDLGKDRWALRVWSNLFEDGLTPDTECYNYYMAASVWAGVHDAATRHTVRVTPFHMLARKQTKLGKGFANYRMGDSGLKGEVLRVFGDMLKHGAIADEESFRNVITAAAREGDLATVKAVLRKVWDVDVDALHTIRDEAEMNVKPIDVKSPLRPTSKLLFTIAHAFGINNDVPAALRIVDVVARRYDINITLDVWSQLFEWTFVLASPRTGKAATTDGSRTGQLPKQSVLSLWETMTSAPYFVKPTMGMFNHLIKNLQHRDWPTVMWMKMQEALQGLYYEERKRANLAWFRLEKAVEHQNENDNSLHAKTSSLETLRRDYESLDLIRRRNIFWVKRWLRLLLSTNASWLRVDNAEDWSLREIPRILWQWRSFAPTLVRYETRGGKVEIVFRTEQEIEDSRKYREVKMEAKRRVLEKVPLLIGVLEQERELGRSLRDLEAR